MSDFERFMHQVLEGFGIPPTATPHFREHALRGLATLQQFVSPMAAQELQAMMDGAPSADVCTYEDEDPGF